MFASDLVFASGFNRRRVRVPGRGGDAHQPRRRQAHCVSWGGVWVVGVKLDRGSDCGACVLGLGVWVVGVKLDRCLGCGG